MTICLVCGITVPAGTAVCPGHAVMADRAWSQSNRIICDFVHRGKEPPRLPPDEREPRVPTLRWYGGSSRPIAAWLRAVPE